MEHNEAAYSIVLNSCYEVYRNLGPGFLENAYKNCLAYELELQGCSVEVEKEIPILYKGKPMNSYYKADIMVDNSVIVEIKAVEKLLPVHRIQLVSYLRMGGIGLGLLVNFNTAYLKSNIIRVIN